MNNVQGDHYVHRVVKRIYRGNSYRRGSTINIKLAVHLSLLAFRYVRALFRELFREIANQSLYTFTISPILVIFGSARILMRNFPYLLFSWLYTYHFSHFGMFVHYFVRLRTNNYTLFTISPILVIFDSARNLTRNLPYRPL